MPSRNSKSNSTDRENYQQVLDQLEEILNTYSPTHAVLLLGDMNASLHQRKGNNQDALLTDFVVSNKLYLLQNGIETFLHPNKTDRAEIDYILSNSQSNQILKAVTVENETSLNTSDHLPVTGILNLNLSSRTRGKHVTRIVCKPKWDRCDRDSYRRSIRENLLPFDAFHLSTDSNIDILEPLSHLNAVLKKATYDSIPKFRAERIVKEIRSRPWSARIQEAVKACHLAWWEWRKSGEPKDKDNPLVLQRKSAKQNLRKEQRQEAARLRRDKVEEIMNASDDSRVFYKLIGEQRKGSNTLLQTLVVNGKERESPDEIRTGWAEHFQELATPLSNPRFDVLTPIFKKGDPSNPGNYRGITVTPVLLKILEHILNARHSQILMNTQSRLQKGFTPGCSSLNAAFILSECILESAMNKQDLFLTTLDTQKAFDVVDQNSLLRKLYLDGIRGNDWLLLKELYSDCSSRIKWAGELSDPINIKQGVRQGGVLSTGHYKRYNNPLLLQLEEGYSGIKIGSISIPHVTVADDLAILAGSKSENQVMVWDVEDSSNRERYCVHPAKSHILWYKFGKKDNSDLDVFLGDARVDVSASATHLGINRSTSQSVDIEGKISLGRKTAYSLMGAGFHGGSGLKAVRNGHVWSTFVVPRLLYGIECQLLKKKEIDSLEKFQRKCLKQLQGLPDNTSSSACLALLGIPPIESVIHKSLLNLFATMMRDQKSIEYEIAQRQIVMKDFPDKSMFTHIQCLLDLYDLPSVFELMSNTLPKLEWKNTLNRKIHEMVEQSWKSDIATKSSTKYLNADVLKVGIPHHIWSTVRNNVHDSIRAQVKCRLLTGTYILQGNRAAFNQFVVDSTCKLCSSLPETRQHFLAECAVFKESRQEYIQKLTDSGILPDHLTIQLQDPVFLTQLTLDCSRCVDIRAWDSNKLGLLELYSREYIYAVHMKRLRALRTISGN